MKKIGEGAAAVFSTFNVLVSLVITHTMKDTLMFCFHYMTKKHKA